MSHQRVNVIVGHRQERMPLLQDELTRQGITNYKFWDAVFLPSVKASINAAHKQIVEYAKIAEFDSVIIAEDDFIGTHPNSFRFFLDNEPPNYDIYLSSVFLGDIDENNIVKSFTGMTLYKVHSRFYDKFLSVNPHEHIDHALSEIGGIFHVCNPMCFTQRDGISGNTGKWESYENLLKNKVLYYG